MAKDKAALARRLREEERADRARAAAAAREIARLGRLAQLEAGRARALAEENETHKRRLAERTKTALVAQRRLRESHGGGKRSSVSAGGGGGAREAAASPRVSGEDRWAWLVEAVGRCCAGGDAAAVRAARRGAEAAADRRALAARRDELSAAAAGGERKVPEPLAAELRELGERIDALDAEIEYSEDQLAATGYSLAAAAGGVEAVGKARARERACVRAARRGSCALARARWPAPTRCPMCSLWWAGSHRRRCGRCCGARWRRWWRAARARARRPRSSRRRARGLRTRTRASASLTRCACGGDEGMPIRMGGRGGARVTRVPRAQSLRRAEMDFDRRVTQRSARYEAKLQRLTAQLAAQDALAGSAVTQAAPRVPPPAPLAPPGGGEPLTAAGAAELRRENMCVRDTRANFVYGPHLSTYAIRYASRDHAAGSTRRATGS